VYIFPSGKGKKQGKTVGRSIVEWGETKQWVNVLKLGAERQGDCDKINGRFLLLVR